MHPPERSELAGVGLGLTVIAVIEETDQRGEAERARHQYRLVVIFVGVLAERIDISGRRLKLLLGELHLAREVVEVADKSRHDFAKARIRRAGKFAQHRLGNVRLILDDH